MTDPIKAGDVVRLKSGSSKMTVTHVDHSPPICACAWFVGGEVRRSEFYAVALQRDDGRSSTRFIE